MSGVKDIGLVVTALKAQLLADAILSTYIFDSGFIGVDPSDLISNSKFPCFSIEPEGQTIKPVPGVSFREMKRNLYRIKVYFAQTSMKRDVAITGDSNKKGIMVIATDIVNAITSDESLGKVVSGLNVEDERVIDIDYLTIEDPERKRWIAGGELSVSFYYDGAE